MDDKIYDLYKMGKSFRRLVFQDVLALFEKQPIKILEIGCIRDLNSREGDGWSTLHFIEYLKNFGGQLVVVDLNPKSIECCKDLVKDYYKNITFHCQSGIDYLLGHPDEFFDLVYLDGSDNPNHMMQEFNFCKARYVLCDDFSSKGKQLKQTHEKYRHYCWDGRLHEMALYGVEKKTVIFKENE